MALTLSAEGFLTALQLADSAFPTGMFAHSHGLEGMLQQGWVAGPGGIQAFLEAQCRWSLLPADGVAIMQTHRYASVGELHTVAAIDRLLQAMRGPSELRTASTQVGRRLLAEACNLTDDPLVAAYRRAVLAGDVPGSSAVAMGVACSALNVPAAVAALAAVHSYLLCEVGAAMRLMSLAHTQAQAIRHALQPLVAAEIERLANTPWQDMTTFTTELDLASMAHEQADLRMFAS